MSRALVQIDLSYEIYGIVIVFSIRKPFFLNRIVRFAPGQLPSEKALSLSSD